MNPQTFLPTMEALLPQYRGNPVVQFTKTFPIMGTREKIAKKNRVNDGWKRQGGPRSTGETKPYNEEAFNLCRTIRRKHKMRSKQRCSIMLRLRALDRNEQIKLRWDLRLSNNRVLMAWFSLTGPWLDILWGLVNTGPKLHKQHPSFSDFFNRSSHLHKKLYTCAIMAHHPPLIRLTFLTSKQSSLSYIKKNSKSN